MKHSTHFWTIKASLGMLGLIGASAVLSQSAIAASSSLTGASIGNNPDGGDVPRFDLICTSNTPPNSLTICQGAETLADVLMGNASAPGGNVELQINTETNNPPFDFTKDFTTLEGTINGSPFFARSLIESDWGSGTGSLTQTWLLEAFEKNNINIDDFGGIDVVESFFITQGGRQRFSDPNISYVFEDHGFLHVGLAGLLNAADLFTDLGFLLPPGIETLQASELVYLEYKNIAGVFYSFSATNAGQSANDGIGNPSCPGGAPSDVNDPLAKCSYSGNYQINEVVPEPLTLLGASAAVGLGGLFKRHASKSRKA